MGNDINKAANIQAKNILDESIRKIEIKDEKGEIIASITDEEVVLLDNHTACIVPN